MLLPRAEGPTGSSPARKGGVFKGSLTRGPKDRHSGCVAPSALLLNNARLIPALRPGPTFWRPFRPHCQDTSPQLRTAALRSCSVVDGSRVLRSVADKRRNFDFPAVDSRLVAY